MLAKIKQDMVTAMKVKDALRVSVLRFLISELKNKEIDLVAQGGTLTNEDVLKTVKKQIKNLNQTIENYKTAGREAESEKQQAEIAILSEYLPQE